MVMVSILRTETQKKAWLKNTHKSTKTYGCMGVKPTREIAGLKWPRVVANLRLGTVNVLK